VFVLQSTWATRRVPNEKLFVFYKNQLRKVGKGVVHPRQVGLWRLVRMLLGRWTHGMTPGAGIRKPTTTHQMLALALNNRDSNIEPFLSPPGKSSNNNEKGRNPNTESETLLQIQKEESLNWGTSPVATVS